MKRLVLASLVLSVSCSPLHGFSFRENWNSFQKKYGDTVELCYKSAWIAGLSLGLSEVIGWGMGRTFGQNAQHTSFLSQEWKYLSASVISILMPIIIQKQQMKSRDALAAKQALQELKPDLLKKDVGHINIKNIHQELQFLITSENKQHSIKRYSGLPKSKLFLLHGFPGTGKSFSAKIVAANVPTRKCYSIKLKDLYSKWAGETQRRISELCDIMRSEKCVVILDEADDIAYSRDGKNIEPHQKQIVNALLKGIDDIKNDPRSDVLIFATTNFEGQLDDAAKRRFDKIIEISLPKTDQERADILKNSFMKIDSKLVNDTLVNNLAQQKNTYLFSPSDLSTLALNIAVRLRDMDVAPEQVAQLTADNFNSQEYKGLSDIITYEYFSMRNTVNNYSHIKNVLQKAQAYQSAQKTPSVRAHKRAVKFTKRLNTDSTVSYNIVRMKKIGMNQVD